MLPSKAYDVTLGLRKFDTQLVDFARILAGVAALDYLLQGAVSLRFTLDDFELDDVSIAGKRDGQINTPVAAGVFGYDI